MTMMILGWYTDTDDDDDTNANNDNIIIKVGGAAPEPKHIADVCFPRKSTSKSLSILLDGIVLAPLLASITYFARRARCKTQQHCETTRSVKQQ